MKLKRFAAGFIAAVMAFAVLGTPLGDILPFVRESVATTAGAETYGDYSYKVLDDGTVEISRYTGNAAVVDIPANINGRRVTSIGDNAFNNYISLTNVTIPDSVTSIGASAFIFCSNLTNITLPKGVTSIGDSAFCNCLSLTSITIPFGVTSIRNSTFYGCSSLTSIAIPKSVTSIGYGAFYYCKSLTSITIPDSVLSIGGYAFSACKTLTSITIPDSVLSIGNSAFSSCEELTRITLPNSVISIGNDTFLGCNKLTSITIPNSVTSIGERVFAGCSSLTAINVAEANKFYSSVDGVLFNKDKTELICYPPSKVDDSYSIPNSVTSIGASAFIYCSNLTNITLPKGVTSIGDGAFKDCSSLTSITIPFGVTSIRNSTFYGCSSLTSITIPNGVTSIGDSAFSGCTSLTSITIPDSVTWIGDRAFEGTALLDKQTTPVKYADSWVVNCDSDVENVIIKSGTKGIANSTFFGCSSLTSITIPNGVTSIGDYTFSNSHNLTSVIISDGVKSIGNSAFEMCSSLTSITLPDSVTSIGESAFLGCESLTSITIPDGVKSIGGYAFESCSSLTSIALSDSMTSIEKYTFNGCSSLTSITLPDSVTSIGEEAFSGCKSLTSITIPDGVKSIGGYAFEDCSSLTSITLPNSVTSIDMHTFDDCTNLSSITIPDSVTSIDGCAFWRCKSLASITIPSSVTRIGNSAFRHCSSLTSITIPSSVTSIDNYAFEDCSSLTSITIPSSVTSIGKSAFEDCNPSFVIRGNTNSEAERYAKDNNIIFKSAGYSVPAINIKSSYDIKIVDNNGNPIKNATVSCGTTSCKATGGFASISFPSAERIWKVSADKYVDKYISENELTADVNTIIMYPVGVAQKCYADKVYYSEKSDIDTVYTSGKINNYVNDFQATEVLTGAKTIDLVRKEYGVIKNYDFYLYCASDSNENATYEVYDGNKRLTTSSTKKIKLSTSMLNESSSLLIVEKFSDGSRNHYGVNLKAVDNKVSENSFELSTGSVSIAPSDDLSWLGSWNIDVPSFPLYAKCTGDEIRIGVGVTKDVLDSDSKFFDYKDSFDKLKDSRKNASPLLKAKSLAKLKSKYIKSNGKTKLPGLKDGFDLTIVGCGYAKIQPGQDTYTLGINVIVTADYSVTLSHQFFVGVIPVTVNIKAGASVEGNFDMSWVKNGNSSGFANNTVLELTVEPYFKPYAGIGIDKVANVGVYGSLAMPIKITFMSPDKNAKGVNSVDIKGEAGLRANVLWFTYNYTIFKGSRNLYTKPQSMMTATIEQRIDVLNSIAYAAQSQREPIEEIFDIDNYAIVKESASAEFTNSNSGLIAGNMSQFSSSDILTSGDMTILATVNTDESRGINNQSYIVTSVYKDGKWSTPERINDSVYSELAPKLYKSGDDIFLIYQQATKEFTDDAANSEITDNIGIAVSKFNPDTMKFENTNMIYSKEGYSFAPKTDGNLAVWVNNGDGNPFGNTDNNSIVIYDGENVTELKTEIGNVLSADVGTLAGNSYIAYTVDKDGDLTTADDIQLYITSSDGSKTNLVAQGDIDSIAFSNKKYDMLLWSDGGKLSYLNSENTDFVISTDKIIGNCFGVLDDNAIYYFDSANQSESGLYVMNYNGTDWTMPYLYSSTDGNVVYAGSDGYNVFYSTCDDETCSGQRKLYSVKIKTVSDIQVNYIDFDPAYLVNSSQIPIDVSLTNNGSETVQTAAFRISDEQMNTINTYTLDNLNIEPGETSECTLLIKPDDNCIGKKIYVTVAEPSDSSVLTDEALDAYLKNDRTPENNRYGLDFTKSDLEVKTEEYKFGESHSLIFTVLNNTDVVTGGTLKVSDSTGKEILSRHFDDISFNESKIAELDESELVPEGKFSDEITVTVISDNDEYYDYNNTATQWISLTFDEKFGDFSATDINKNGLTLKWDGISQKCGVFIEQLVGDEWKEIATLNDGSVGKYAVSGLTESTKYEFRIRAFKNYGSETGYSECKMLEVSTCHVFGEWQTTVKPTCTEGGEMIRSCSVCGAEETKTIDALGHDYSDQWTVDEEADCVNDGSKSRHCSRCDAKTDVTVIEAKGHTEVVDKAVAATCTADGYTEGKHCSVCNAVIKAQEKIAATGHKYVETVVEPSYSNRGYTLYECSVCGYSYKDNYEEQLIVPAVTGFASGSQTKSSAVLGWDKVSGADGYAVELYTGGKWNEVFRTSDSSVTSCTVGSLKADSIYSLRIRAFKDTDDGTVYSDYTRLAVKTKLAGVTGLKAQGVTATAVKLDWARNAGATGYIIEQYKGGKWTQLAVTKNNTTLTFTVKGLAECTPYSFRVKAYKNDGGKTNYSDYVTVKASTLLGTVKNAKVTSTTGTWITLEWAKNDKATGYSIEQYKGGKWTVIATTKNNATLKFTVKGLKNDTTYSFRIRAYKTAGGVTAYSDYVRIAGKTRIPNVATFKGSAVSASEVKLDWSKNDKATGYVIEQYKGGKWTAITTTKNNTTLTFTVKGLAKGTAYSFRIKSFRKTGSTTEFSEYASVKVKTVE